MADATCGRRFDVSRHRDTARRRADVLLREAGGINDAMVVLARWIGEASAVRPSSPRTAVPGAAA